MKYLLLLTIAFSALPAHAQLGRMCSLSWSNLWAVAIDPLDQTDVCATANTHLLRQLDQIGISRVVPPFYTNYVQSFFNVSSNNTAVLTCRYDGTFHRETFSGYGIDAIQQAIEHGRSHQLQGCHIETEDLTNPQHPVRDTSMQAYCYAHGSQFSFAVANPGFGYGEACRNAVANAASHKFQAYNAGYFLAAGETRVQFHCPSLEYDTAFIYGANDFVRLASYLKNQNTDSCVITTDIFGGSGFGQSIFAVVPGFEERGSTTPDIPPASSITDSITQSSNELANGLSQLDQLTIQEDIIDKPKFDVNPETGEAMITMPSNIANQVDLGKQKRQPEPRTPTSNNSRRSENFWKFGNNFIGLRLGYTTESQNFQYVKANAYAAATIFAQIENLFSGHGSLSYSQVSSDQVASKALMYFDILDKTYNIIDKTAQGYTLETLPRKALLSAELYQQALQLMVGPIPVYGTVKVIGDTGYDSIRYGLESVHHKQYILSAQIVPYGQIKVLGTAGVGVPIAHAGVMGEVNLIDGKLAGGAVARAFQQDRQWQNHGCVYAGVQDLRFLNGQMFAYYSVKEPVTAYVEQTVKTGCKIVKQALGGFLGGLFEREVCQNIERHLQEVTRWTTFFHRQSYYKWNGRQTLGQHYWINTCGH